MRAEELIKDEDIEGLGALRMEMVLFGVEVLPRLRRMSFEERKEALLQCSEHSLREPLQYHHKRDLKVPGWHQKELLNGAQIIVLMAFGLFVQMSERKDACAALIEMFPEIEAAARADKRRREVAERADRVAEQERLHREAPLFALLVSAEEDESDAEPESQAA